jgi:hypothetical protein
MKMILHKKYPTTFYSKNLKDNEFITFIKPTLIENLKKQQNIKELLEIAEKFSALSDLITGPCNFMK